MTSFALARALVTREYWRFLDSEGALDVAEELRELEAEGWQFIPPPDGEPDPE